jgi:hypothetical protein
VFVSRSDDFDKIIIFLHQSEYWVEFQIRVDESNIEAGTFVQLEYDGKCLLICVGFPIWDPFRCLVMDRLADGVEKPSCSHKTSR